MHIVLKASLFPTEITMDDWNTLSTTIEPTEEPEIDCVIPDIPDRRWYLVAVVGTSLSLVSLISNILIARVLLQRKHSNFFFLGLLAISDVFISLCYGPVIAMELVRYDVSLLLVKAWLYYVGPLLSLCHVSMTFSCFMIILGSIERYMITVKSPFLGCFRESRGRLALSMLILALLLRGTVYFEIQIVKNGNCTGPIEYDATLTPLVSNWLYGTIFRFYIRTISTVFIPFGLLSYLNYKIVTILRKQQRSAAMFRFGNSENKTKIRSATRLLVLIVFSYLCANSLNLSVTIWEYIDLNSVETYYEIYEAMTDVTSMLYIFTCATRLLVYLTCNEEIKFAILNYLLCHNGKEFPTSPQGYKPIQKLQYDVSERQRSVNLGTEFDKVVIKIAAATSIKRIEL
ncbi:G-PROTEIN-RECEP-F1-2 domain-containing protein [Aphelenchoides besseyi]|nr:G-PROTEIN-RECEP-F1-2 domain-containing protein [Aphelenchoides besseyi]KAI6194053.1 G-PROTEIN-RECEP-F1-2 domain-containing protein [Aphelenchoides besseyi]